MPVKGFEWENSPAPWARSLICLLISRGLRAKSWVLNRLQFLHRYYSGTATLTRMQPMACETRIGDERFDCEGRFQFLEFPDFFLINTYVPNAKNDLSRLNERQEFDHRPRFDGGEILGQLNQPVGGDHGRQDAGAVARELAHRRRAVIVGEQFHA